MSERPAAEEWIEHDPDDEICPVTGAYCTGLYCDDYGCAKAVGIWDDEDDL